MDVVDVLEACKTETENTHWCQGHYETITEWLGTPEEFAEFINTQPNLYQKSDRPITSDDGQVEDDEDVEPEDVMWLYKVQHCLMGMVNTNLGVSVSRSSTDTWGPSQAERTDIEPWLKTVNRLGLTIFGERWDPNRRVALDPDNSDDETVSIESWNDHAERTREDVLEVLAQAIEAEKEESERSGPVSDGLQDQN